MPRNYYRILGIDPDATQAQIKSAYRQKAKELHPDCSGGECEPFHDIQEAYETLSNPARRRRYDSGLARDNSPLRVSRTPRPEPLRPRPVPTEPLIPTARSVWETNAPLFCAAPC